jgi:hypothetical protein
MITLFTFHLGDIFLGDQHMLGVSALGATATEVALTTGHTFGYCSVGGAKRSCSASHFSRWVLLQLHVCCSQQKPW